MLILIFFSYLLACLNATVSAQYNYLGCYSQSHLQSLGLTSKGSYTYQSVSYCQQQCGDSNVVALLNGDECFCGDSVDGIASLGSTSDGTCTTPCNGWPYQNCGGPGAIDLYVNAAADVPTSIVKSSTKTLSPSSSTSTPTSKPLSSTPNVASSTSTTSSALITTSSVLKTTLSITSEQASTKTTTTLKATSTSEISTTPKSTSTLSASSSTKASQILTVTETLSSSHIITTQRISYITSIKYGTNIITKSIISQVGGSQKTVYVTATSVKQITTATTTLGLSTLNKGTTSAHHKLSGGSIAGIVVGVVCGVILLIAILVFLFWRRRKDTPDEYTEYKETIQHQPYSFGNIEHNATVIPVIPKNKHTSDSFGGSSKTEYVESFSSPQLATTVTNPSFIFEAPNYYDDRDIFSASSIHNADEGMLHIVNPDSNHHNDIGKNGTNVSTNDHDSSNISIESNESDDSLEKFQRAD
ncbi:protein Slg1p [Monosporozyma servazzii]